ncbi:beta-galactosidase [Jeotgalibacillus aurantiacus]|uniref:beta-galactosidase n=1 Tax=Jeotgalibacillus aurantiacus TaxID=2763266 RepID=UPI001D0AF1E6|nr:beta-galactosidase [Jeotgalibacillus aurantiacus]
MYVGVDYYPEHWPEDMLEKDLDGIKELGANMIRIGEFAWHLMESTEGSFDFSFFDKVIEEAKKRGIDVMFGTPTATFPAWLAKKHPSILSKDEYGHVRAFGGRRQYCFNSDEYNRYAAKITEEVVKHYANEPAVVAWQIDNEFGHEGSDWCFCEQCHSSFHQFLEKKYKTVEELNERWGTIFWGQTYNEFSEIPMPVPTVTTHNPSLKLDYSRFRSESVNGFAHRMTDVARKYAGAHQPITTNVSGGFFDKAFDHAENVRPMDFVSYDNYPVWGGLTEPIPPAAIAMTHDFNRGLKDQNYWIVEELMGAQGHNVIGYLPRPNQAKMWSYQAFAHGCTNMLYFRWRGMTKGAEQFCFGVVDQDNRYGRKFKEVQSLFSEILPYENVLNQKVESDIAVLYDYDNIWSWKSQVQSASFDFNAELMRLYTPFYRHNASIDVIPADRDFAKYRVLLVPVMQIIDDELAARLTSFAEAGGTIIFSFRAGLKDRDNNIHFKQTLPGPVAELAGIEIYETEALAAHQSVPVQSTDGKKAEGRVWRDLVTVTTADVLYKYADEFYEERAAMTVNSFGEGKVYYLATGLATTDLEPLALNLIQEHGIWHAETPEGTEAVKRDNHLFLMNHTGIEQKVMGESLPPYGSKVVKLT